MAKVTLNSISSTANKDQLVQSIDDNFKAIQNAFDNTVSRDGSTPNSLDADLDMNSRRVINVADPVNGSDVVTKSYLDNYPSIIKVTFNWLGDWTTSTSYKVNDSVQHNGSSYVCVVDHTSDASTEPGVGGSYNTVWDLVAAKGDTGNPAKATATEAAAGTDDIKYMTPYLVKTYYQTKNTALDNLTTIDSGALGSVKVTGSTNGWQGIQIVNYSFVAHDAGGSVAIYNTATSSYIWQVDSSGALLQGTVPWSALTSVPAGTTSFDQGYYESAAIAIVAGAQGTIAHSVGRTPKFIYGFLKCKTANNGWVVGDEVPLSVLHDGDIPVFWPKPSDPSNTLFYTIGSNLPLLTNEDQTGSPGSTQINGTNWDLYVRFIT